ncbi:hypothetical protein B0H63DRAFT_294494 [Podospora didyma]|uniref:Uncharacterized protein n=1 Tax=Podospora didyma TaxID=330526 RepID=A0AAE0KA75_9PEZI|nr:hypothetical protein B0H63DRAFT_294494 [Podospora didyma]
MMAARFVGSRLKTRAGAAKSPAKPPRLTSPPGCHQGWECSEGSLLIGLCPGRSYLRSESSLRSSDENKTWSHQPCLAMEKRTRRDGQTSAIPYSSRGYCGRAGHWETWTPLSTAASVPDLPSLGHDGLCAAAQKKKIGSSSVGRDRQRNERSAPPRSRGGPIEPRCVAMGAAPKLCTFPCFPADACPSLPLLASPIRSRTEQVDVLSCYKAEKYRPPFARGRLF